MLEEAGSDLALARQSIERWFDDTMQRVEGWYKRQTQTIVLVVALLVVTVLNTDSLMLANTLSRDATLRASVAQAAAQFVAEQQASQSADANATAQPEQHQSDPEAQPDQNQPDPAAQPDPVEEIKRLRQELLDASMPVGWLAAKTIKECQDPRFLPFYGACAAAPVSIEWWTAKLVGLLMTVVLVSLGAPFWFDLLNKLVNLRATGTPPKTKEETPKPAAP